MSARGAYGRRSPAFKLQICSDIRSGELARREAQRTLHFSANLIQMWLGQARIRGELDTEEVAATQIAEYEAKIAALERKLGQLTMEMSGAARAAAGYARSGQPGRRTNERWEQGMKPDPKALRTLAVAATPGPCKLRTSNSWRRYGSRHTGSTVLESIAHASDVHPDLWFRNGGFEGPDARYIAAANPAVMLAPVSPLEAVERGRDGVAARLAVIDPRLPAGSVRPAPDLAQTNGACQTWDQTRDPSKAAAMSADDVRGLAIKHGSQEAYSGGGQRQDFPFREPPLFAFADAIERASPLSGRPRHARPV